MPIWLRDFSNLSRPRIQGKLWLAASLLLIASLACSLPGISGPTDTAIPPSATPSFTPPAPTATPQPQPPSLIEIIPSPETELPLSSPVKLYFNQAMNRASVEAALSVQPAPAGSFSWEDDATLVFNPSEPLPPESEITFAIGENAKARSGLALEMPVSLRYRTAGLLHLAEAIPAPDAQQIEPTSAVVATFNRPVAPLGAESDSLAPAFNLEPAVQGSGEWLNTSTYIFYPDPALEGGRQYTVNLNPDLRSADGSPLEEITSWSFTTSLPRLVSIEPPAGSGLVPLDKVFELTFNQPMDPASVEANLSLSGPGGELVETTAVWNEDTTHLTLTPTGLLGRNAIYTLGIGAQAQARGGTVLGEETSASVATVPEMAVIASDPPQNGLKSQYSRVALYMSGPIEDDHLRDLVSVQPVVSNLEVYWNEYDRAISLYGNFDPELAYVVRLEAGLRDPWGATLSEPYVLNFRTTPLEPELTFVTGWEALLVTGQESAIPVQAVNISTLQLASGPVPLSDFIAMTSGPNSYELRQGYRAAGEQVWSTRLDLAPNRRQTVGVGLNPAGEPLDPGLYYLRYDAGLERGNLPMLIISSNRQVTFKLSATEALVWVVDLNTNQPVAGAPVVLYDPLGTALASGQTASDGVFRVEVPVVEAPYDTYYAVISQPGMPDFGMAASTWSQGISPWDFGLLSDYRGPYLKAYLYTDRPIYRPGQTVYFRGVVRRAYNGRYELPDLESLPLTLYQDYSTELVSFDLPLSDFGTISGEYTLPEEMTPGNYRLASTLSEYDLQVFFDVAEYRKPEINLQVVFDSAQARQGDELGAEVSARYFFDAPAGNLKLQWTLLKQSAFFYLPGYQVGVEDFRWLEAFYYPDYGLVFGSPVDQGEAMTDEQGRVRLAFNPELTDGRTRYTLEVTATDESGLPVSARGSIEVNPGDYYIGARPDAWVGRSGEALGFAVQVVDWEAVPQAAEGLQAEFSKVVFVRDETQPEDPFMGPKYVPEYTLVSSADFGTNASGEARLAFTPPEPGTYQLTLSGGAARTELLLWVGGPGQAIWPSLPNQRLRLTLDMASYRPGDTAQVFIPNPFAQDSQALVTVERGTILSHSVITLPPGGENYTLPVTAAEAPNVYVAVTLLGQAEGGRPDFRQGFVNLPVEPVEQTLNVALTSQPERTGPGEEVLLTLEVTDAAGQSVQGEFSVAVVDLAVLALADPNAPPIEEAFYSNQPLGVRTAQALAVYAQRSVLAPGGLGGGGGDGMATQVVRESFPDTAFWQAAITTDAAGRAEVRVPLPDSLTTWQVTVRGLTEDTRVGQAEVQIITSKELLVRPVTPRFLVVGDHLELAAVVQNNTGSAIQAQVSLQASGFELDNPGQLTQEVSVPANGRLRVSWWGTVSDVAEVDLVFAAQGEDAAGANFSDAAHPAGGVLPVQRYVAPQTFRTAGVQDEGGEILELISLPRSFDPQSGSLKVELSSSLAGAVLRALEALEHYPYECTEQTLSRFLPNLETYRALQEFGMQAPALEARLDRTLDEGVQSLRARQNEDGGWGWWKRGESDFFITSYVVFGLSRARQAGVILPEGMLENGVQYLLGALTTPAMTLDREQLDRLAFAQFALAEAGSSDRAGAEALYAYRDQLSPWAQALLALTLENQSPGSSTASTLLSDLQGRALRSATGVHWEQTAPGARNMSTPLSTSAIVIYALAQRDPASPLLADAVRYLMSHRLADGTWNSTFSSAWVLMALAEVMRGTGELGGNFGFGATLNSTPLASGQAGGEGTPVLVEVPIDSLYPDYPNALVIQREAGPGRLYYTAGLEVLRPVEEVSQLSRGIHVSRAYFPSGVDCRKESCTPVNTAAAGDLVQVHLTLTLQEAAYYLLVEDFIPAGTEILDTSLKTSQQSGFEGGELGEGEQEPAPLYDPQRPFSEGWNWWLFNDADIFDDRITWAADYLPAGTYELAYTLVILQPGEYRVLPAHAWQFYFPEVQGVSAGEVFTVLP